MEGKIDLRRAQGKGFEDTDDDSEWEVATPDPDDSRSPAMQDGHPAAADAAPTDPLLPIGGHTKSAPEIGVLPPGSQPSRPSTAGKAGTAPVLRNSGRQLLDALDEGTKGPKALFKKRPNDGEPPAPTYDFNSLKNNSTSSLYIKDTLSHPDRAEVQRCVSAAVLKHITDSQAEEGPDLSSEKRFEIFSELVHPIEKTATVSLTSPPSQNEVFKFISTVFATQQIPPECSILCLCYIERLLTATRLRLHPWNWRRVLLGTLMIASKVYEDLAVWNIDFQPQFPFLSVSDLNALERTLLQLLEYNVSIKASQYAKYFFELRGFSKLEDSLFPIKPLSTEDAEKLEQRSLQRFDGKQPKIKRTKSSEQFFEKSPRGRAVLQ